MEFSLALVQFAGTAALLLWGTHMVRSGVERAYGPRLRTLLGRALRSRFTAVLAGTAVTAALQSSTATGLMVTGFTASGLVALVPALAVMLGAGVGSTLIVQALSFDVTSLAPALVLLGVVLFRRDGAAPLHDLGRVFIGLGLMLMALHQLIALLEPYEQMPELQTLLAVFSAVPMLNLILGALLTWLTHSSVAVVLLVMSLAVQGILEPAAAFAFVLGANLGTALNPLMEGGTAGDPVAKRLPVGNLLTRIVGALLALAALEPLVALVTALDPERAVANFHTLFNLALALLFLPLLDPLAALLRRMLPERDPALDPARPLYLDEAARETPVIALGGAAREALRLADVLEQMLEGARSALVTSDRRLIAETRRLDDVLDRLNGAIKSYLTGLDPDDLSPEDQRRLNDILVFATNLEQAGDVVERNLLPHAAKRLKRGLAFSRDGQEELSGMIDRLIVNLRTAASLLMTGDRRAARLLADEKVAFRQAEAAATEAHFDRLRAGRLDSVQTSALHLDLLRDLKLVNSRIVSAAAYPVLERSGELLPSRLAGRDRRLRES